MFKKILYPTDFEEFSLPNLESLACLKKAGLEEVVLLYVIDTDSFQTEVDGGVTLNLDLVRQTAMQKLDVLAEFLRSEGIGVTSEISIGPLVAEILETAAKQEVSLIVAGRQKRDILGELFVGSTTDRIIRKSKAPVLVAKYHTLQEVEGKVEESFCLDLFRKILYATDWSPGAERAKAFLPALRQVGASEAVVVHVTEKLPYEAEYLNREALAQQVEEKMGALEQELQSVGFQVKTYTLEGKPYREINRLATEEDVSLIVMGCHGMGWVEGMLWGSVSQRVAEYSEKPVLVVK
jgi:nucleotide-binding universal stress UspA family protein